MAEIPKTLAEYTRTNDGIVSFRHANLDTFRNGVMVMGGLMIANMWLSLIYIISNGWFFYAGLWASRISILTLLIGLLMFTAHKLHRSRQIAEAQWDELTAGADEPQYAVAVTAEAGEIVMQLQAEKRTVVEEGSISHLAIEQDVLREERVPAEAWQQGLQQAVEWQEEVEELQAAAGQRALQSSEAKEHAELITKMINPAGEEMALKKSKPKPFGRS
jgi:ABC-type multidrug transport system fused ATPase/permease subunit